jgi:membrane-associated phospholipid phosphatase
VTALIGLAWAGPEFFAHKVISPSCPCEESDVNSFDRGVAGWDSEDYATASDIAVTLSVVAPFALDALETHRKGTSWNHFANDALLISRSILVSGAVQEAVKLLAQRPRPRLYGVEEGDPALEDDEEYVSFYSGHTTTAFAAGMSYATLYASRHPTENSRWWVYAGAMTLGTTVGVLRIQAGSHFPTDVILGAVMGTAFGIAIPRIHQRDQPQQDEPPSFGVAFERDGAFLTYSKSLP